MAEEEELRFMRVWDFFDTGEDFYKIRSWPRYLREMALRAHKNYRERYRLFLFFVANGVEPRVAYEWVSLRDVVNGRPVYEAYDASANAQMASAIKDADEGRLLLNRSWYDMRLGRVVHDKGY